MGLYTLVLDFTSKFFCAAAAKVSKICNNENLGEFVLTAAWLFG